MRNLHCRRVTLGYLQSGRSTVRKTISAKFPHGRTSVRIDTVSLTDYRHITLLAVDQTEIEV